MPELQYRANAYDPSLKPRGIGLYVLRVEAEHLAEGSQQVWQVVWDGDWEDDPEEMKKHISIKEVGREESKKMIEHDMPPRDGQ